MDELYIARSNRGTTTTKVLVLNGVGDRQTAENYCVHMKRDILSNHDNVDISLYDEQYFNSLGEAFDWCDIVFVLITKQFCENDWLSISKENCFMNSLYNVNRKCSIIPVLMEKEIECGFRTPMALNSIRNLKYYNNDSIYKVAMRRVLLLKP